MRRKLADMTKIINRADQPRAEQVMPQTIDHHACRQRIIRSGNAICQFQAAAARIGKGGR